MATEEETSFGDPELVEAMTAKKDWHRVIAFDERGIAIAGTCTLNNNELKEMVQAFSSYDETIKNGIMINDVLFDVHQYYETMIYGRMGDCMEGEGFAICKSEGADGHPIFVCITYRLPILSARAVPQLSKFCKEHMEKRVV